jgi:hypothetical protein
MTQRFLAHSRSACRSPALCAYAAYVIAGVSLIATHAALAQQAAYPSRNIRLIASQAAGGGVDLVARLVSSKLNEALGQPVVVDNKPGAHGSLAGDLTAKSPPDGYPLMIGAVGNLGVNTFFIKQMSYDPLQDLAPVTLAVSGANVLVVHPSVPAKSVRELIALARLRPGALAYGTTGIGGTGHLAGALFQSLAKIELLHVPYKGGAPAMVDLLAGETQITFASSPTVAPNINTGRLKALAVTTLHRTRLFPQLPTIAESGVPGYEAQSWYGFVVPAKTPSVIVARLNREIVQILNRADSADALLKSGMEPWTSTPEAFGSYIKAEHSKWGRIIKEAGITAN